MVTWVSKTILDLMRNAASSSAEYYLRQKRILRLNKPNLVVFTGEPDDEVLPHDLRLHRTPVDLDDDAISHWEVQVNRPMALALVDGVGDGAALRLFFQGDHVVAYRKILYTCSGRRNIHST